MSKTTKTSVGISGADSIIMIDGIAYGDIQSFKYANNQIELQVGNFIPIDVTEPIAWEIEKILEDLRNGKMEMISVISEMSLLDMLSNEKINTVSIDSVMSYKRFEDVTFLYQKGGVEVDQISQYTTFVFSYNSHTPTKHLLCEGKFNEALEVLRSIDN